MSWIRKVSGPRVAPQGAVPNGAPAAPAAAAAKEKLADADLDLLAPARLSEKVLAQAGASLKGAVPDLTAIAERADRLEPHRALQLGRALDTFYQRLGKELARVPAADRQAAAEATVKALRTLVERVAHEELVGPAVSGMTDLVRYFAASMSSREPLPGRALADAAAAAERAMSAVIDTTDGRMGAASALNVYPNLVWQVENRAPLAGAARFERWSELAQFTGDVLPRARIEQVEVAELAAKLAVALDRDPKTALTRVKAEVFDAAAMSLAPARGQLGQVPANLQGDGRAAFDAMARAMTAVLDANPQGPGSIGAAMEALAGRVFDLTPNAGAPQSAAWRAIAKVLEAAATTPAVETMVRFLSENVALVLGDPRALQALEAPGADAGALVSALVRAQAARLGLPAQRLDVALAKLDALPETPRLAAALAILQQPRLAEEATAPALVQAIAESAASLGHEALATFASRFATAFTPLAARLGAERALPAAAALARTNLGEALDPARAEAVAELASMVVASMPDAPLAKMMVDDAERRPGLLTLTNAAAYRFPPANHLAGLLGLARDVRLPPEAKLEVARQAMFAAGELSKLDRDPGATYQVMQRDWRAALADPNALHFAVKAGDAIGIRAGGARKNDAPDQAIVRFFREHAGLPPELAVTAGVHFSAEQMTWLMGQVTATRSRAQVRNVRDGILAVMEAGHPDLVEVMRTSRSPTSAITGTLAYIATEYRGGRLGQVPFDAIRRGLEAGEDPAAQIERERAQAALAQMGLANLNAGRADAQGLETMKKALPDVQGILRVLPENGNAHGAPSAKLREPFLACLRAVVDGTWHTARYEGDVAKRQLAKLTPEQRAIWAEESITPMQAAAPQPAGPELAEAMTLVRGLGPALVKEARLPAIEGLPALAYDVASRDLLRGEVAKLSTELHEKVKGSDEHRTLSKKIGPMAASLAVIDLVLALEDVRAKGVQEPTATIARLRPLMSSGMSAARKLGARGSADAMKRVLETAPEVKQSPRAGVYAADEDALDAFVTAFDGGCMRAQGGGNQGGQIEFITSPQYKMLRVCNGEVGVTRSVIRLLDVELPNYKGMALWIDGPYTTNRGGNPTPEMWKLAYKHALNKARAMGIPLMYGPIGYGGGKDSGAPAMQEVGAVSQPAAAKVSFDRGTTGFHHCQSLLGDQKYWVTWPGFAVGNYPIVAEDQTRYQADINCSVVMP